MVDLLLDPTRTPTNAEYEALEACFEQGNIRCDSVDGNDCRMVDDCYANDARDWEACQEGAYFHCRSALGQTDRRYRCQNTYDSCEHGSLARYRLKIPESTKPSALGPPQPPRRGEGLARQPWRRHYPRRLSSSRTSRTLRLLFFLSSPTTSFSFPAPFS